MSKNKWENAPEGAELKEFDDYDAMVQKVESLLKYETVDGKENLHPNIDSSHRWRSVDLSWLHNPYNPYNGKKRNVAGIGLDALDHGISLKAQGGLHD